MSGEPAVRLEPGERVTVLRLNHGPNALDDALMGALDGELAKLELAGAPALIVASDHRTIFCPGLDLRKVDGLPREAMRAFMVRFNALLRRLVAYPGPTVAALAGHAIAGGCLLALACDRRVMAAWGARLGLSEINLGIPVPAGAVHMLRTLFSARAVDQLVLDGDGFSGERALEAGLVERLAEPDTVLAEAYHLAEHLASRPPTAFAAAKTFLRDGLARTMEERDAREGERFLDLWYDAATQDRIGAVIASMNAR
jgi:enoyl-CoA hydratase/carnithine racemase